MNRLMCLNHTRGLGSDFICEKEKNEKLGLGEKAAPKYSSVGRVLCLPCMQEALGSIHGGGVARRSGTHMKS